MDKVYVCSNENKNKLKKILESEPTAPMSFARQGYDLKDGRYYGVDGWILYISGDDKFMAWAEDQIGDIAKQLPDDEAEKIINAIKKEKDSASEGFGKLFG